VQKDNENEEWVYWLAKKDKRLHPDLRIHSAIVYNLPLQRLFSDTFVIGYSYHHIRYQQSKLNFFTWMSYSICMAVFSDSLYEGREEPKRIPETTDAREGSWRGSDVASEYSMEGSQLGDNMAAQHLAMPTIGRADVGLQTGDGAVPDNQQTDNQPPDNQPPDNRPPGNETPRKAHFLPNPVSNSTQLAPQAQLMDEPAHVHVPALAIGRAAALASAIASAAQVGREASPCLDDLYHAIETSRTQSPSPLHPGRNTDPRQRCHPQHRRETLQGGVRERDRDR
jgi:hypothetical protein